MSSAFGDVIVYSLGSAPDTVEGTKGTGRWAVPARQTRTELMSRVFVTMAMSLDGFITVPAEIVELDLVRVLEAPGTLHLRYAVTSTAE
jgi:hypothetical protein